jgi:CBS domain-containing membrane protein
MLRRFARLEPLARWIGVEHSPVSHGERLLSGCGGFLGIVGILIVSQDLGISAQLLILASMGASAVLLFAVPHGALSQPWPLVGGHLLSAAIGVASYRWVAQPQLAAALAVGVSITVMHYLRCLHPPGGATALIAVIGGPDIHQLGFHYLLYPVGLNVLLILSIAILFNAALPWRRYPVAWARPQQVPDHPLALQHDDLAAALSEIDSFIDVDEDDLKLIFSLAEKHARERRARSRRR